MRKTFYGQNTDLKDSSFKAIGGQQWSIDHNLRMNNPIAIVFSLSERFSTD